MVGYVKHEIQGEAFLDYAEGPPLHVAAALRPRRPSAARRAWAWLRKLVAGIALLAVALVTGCHSVSGPALNEAHVAASAGDSVLAKWDTLTDAQKKTAVTKLTRAEYSVLNSADGTEIPAQYLPLPATSDATTIRTESK